MMLRVDEIVTGNPASRSRSQGGRGSERIHQGHRAESSDIRSVSQLRRGLCASRRRSPIAGLYRTWDGGNPRAGRGEIVGLTPQNKSDLINEEVGEIGTVGAADRPRITAMLSEGGNFAYYYSPRRRSFSRRCGSLDRSRSGARAINWFSL